jgi:hypothetical protein
MIQILQKIKLKRHSIKFHTRGMHLNMTRTLPIKSHQALHLDNLSITMSAISRDTIISAKNKLENKQTNCTPITFSVKSSDTKTNTDNNQHNNNDNILELLDTPDDDNITAETFNPLWRQMYTQYIQNNENIVVDASPSHQIWNITEAQKNLTELYYIQAQNMHENNLINVLVPNYMTKYTNEPADVISIKRNNWLIQEQLLAYFYFL